MSMNEAVKEVDKHLPASEHDKLWEEMRPTPCGFEVLPSAGTLAPGQQCHVQVRFSPTEEKCYRGELQIQICQSSQRLRVPVLGCGLQPRLELSPAELELGPLLPQSHGEEGTVVGSLVSLDQDQLSFGAVVRQSYTCRRVVMRNAGNTGVRFLVVIDMLKPENLESSSVLQGCSYIDVTFLNETTGEYLFHMVTFKVMALGPIGTVEMSTAVRQRVSSTVKVDNPLPVPVTFAINCKGPFLIPAGGTTSISFRNVFPRATAFQYAVKHPAFSVRAPEMLRAKSSTTITVSFTGGPAPVTSRLTTRQRLASPREMRRPRATQLRDMGEVSHQKFSAVGLDQRLFQPFPSEVVFENYVPRQFYIAALALRNIDRVPRLLNVILGNSPYFELISPSNEDYKVAPGMSSTYRILFRPDEDKDYFDELIIITEREKFFVPIRAIGARASLDFPEQLNFSECPVRFSTQKTLLVRNVGKREACYSITTLSPFSVDPSIGTLGIGEAMEVTVEFHPPKTGVYTSPMIVHYDTGEDVHKSLCGTAVNVNIRLDKSSLTVEKTSVTLSKLRSLVIHNQSAITAHFQWKRFVDQEEEEREGDVLPNSSLEISVIFQPKEARVYQETVYCDISGCETRLPLCISGEGVGPQVQLSCDQLSIGEVTVGSSHSYRVFLLNRGVTETPFSVVSPERALGSCFTFGPREGMLLPFDHQAIWISFNASVVGQFTEEFQFNVKGSPEPLTLTVTGPAFHFNVSSLRFGEVSFGFPRTLCCRLTNTSSVPFNFNLRIPGDGSGAPSVTSIAQVSDSTGPSWRKRAPGAKKPAEFTIRPSTGIICAKGHLDIQVTLCSNTVKRYKLALVVDVDGVGREVLSLPVRARCIIPPLRVLHPALTFGRCSLKVPYQQMLTLVNDSNLPGCYWALPQENKDAAAVWYSSPEPRGIIQPHSSVEIPFTLEVQVTGKQDTVAHVAVFGSKESPLEIHLLSTGEGPVVHVHPSEINFGSIQVLQDASRTLHLSNQSVIPASFSAKMAGADSCWTVGPSQGVIPAKAEVSLAVTANLDDTEQFKDEVVLFIENSRAYVIPVQAVGVGTTIVIDKPFGPELNLAPCFSLDPCCYRFKMTNKGRRTHLLYWTTEGGTTLKQRKRLPRISKSKGKVSSCGPVLKLQPLRTELMPGQTAEVVLKGSCSTPQVVKEKLLCHAIVGKEGVKNLIVQVDVTCEFIAPALQISSREITFRVEKHPGDVLAVMYKPLSVKNMCSLPLSVVLALEQPFSICTADQQPLPTDAQPMKLRTGEELQLCIGFNPAYEEDLLIRAVEKALKIKFLEHPHEEQVTVRGEVYFPNLQIQTTAVDLGCILNDTKDVRYMEMTNCSPLVVQYHWAFLKDSQVNPVCSFSRFMETEPLALGVEEVFDILPLHGELQPGQSQRVCFSFFGHANTVSQVTALCRVEGGPSYEVALRGEASRISYLLDTTEIDCGLQVFNKVTEAAVTLQNSGKLGFAFAVLSPGTGTAASPLPGVPLVVPSRGYVEPGKQQVLKVYYLPGVPGVFCRAFQIQLGHLEPEKISLKGEGTFPRIHLDLPRNIKGNAKYEKILLKAKEKLDKGSQREEAIALGEAVAAEPRVDDSGTVWDAQLQMQMEEMLIEEHALEQQKALASRPPEDTAFHQRVHRRLLKLVGTPVACLQGPRGAEGVQTSKPLQTAQAPPLLTSCERGISKPVSLCREADPTKQEEQGMVQIPYVLFQVRGGPTFQVRLRAIVAEPSLCLSRDRLEFSSVQCGQWQEETIQLHNTSQVPCKWSMSMNEAVKEVDKHLPASEHDKLWEEMRPAPCGFEVLPSAGTLAPGQQCHVQVRFSPTEEKCYRGELQIQICQSSQRLRVPVLGCGLQPRLELSPAELELGPLLPQSHGEEGTVVVDVVHPPGKVVKLGNICIGQTVTFSPKRRMQPFSGEVLLECRGLVRSLFAVRGSCQGSLVSLDQDQLSFGAVVRQSYTCRRIVMRNAGNTGVRFLWDVESFQPDFSISPTKGYIRPGVDVPFVVTFRPSKLSQAVQYEGLRCFIPGSEALRLTLSGSTLTFICNVREKQSQTILLSNPSSDSWTLKPIVEGKYWKGPEFIHLEARFLVVIDMLKPENLESSSVLQGCSYIDVPSSAKKDYQLTFFSYKEGVYRAKVTFLNETTGEYLFHMVTFKVMASGPIGTVEMSTAVRQRVSSTVKVDNPLPVPVTFAINCKVPGVSVPQCEWLQDKPDPATDCADFQTAKSISAAPASAGGSELNVEGPFLIPAGGTTSISFRNVFPRATAFQYAVKHPAFSVRAPEMLRAKSSTTITVSFTGGPAPVTSSPFSVDPSIGTLGVGEAMEVTVEFHPPKTGVYTSPMIVHYDTVPYQQMLTLVNDSNLPGCYWALPQENKDAAAVWYSSPEPRGIIQPHSSVEIPFTLEVQVTGKQDTVARVAVFGSKESPLAGADSCWTVGPSQGVIPAKAEVSLAVTANLDDTEQFKDEVVLFIENSRAYVIPVQAVGVGTTIVIDKPFGPELNLAPCFSLDPCCYRFKMTNKGRRTHLLYWTTEGGTTLKQRKRLPRISKSKGKVSSCGPVLKLQPLRTELMPGQTAEVVLKGSCSTPQVVKEKLLCHAIVGKEGVKNLIVQVDVTCEFIAPALQISSREITFRVEKHPSDVLAVMYKPLSVKNMCSLPLSVVLALEQPFSICTADQQPLPADAQPMKLRTGEELQLCIGFNPAYEEDLLIRAAEKALKIKFLEHPHEEQVTVRGEVYFPNLQIQTTAVDFGCILNDTKDVRYMEMTNCSPLVVQYHWAFLKDSQVNPVRFMETEPLALGVEEVFDILPLHGELQPGQSQRVCFSFFGHANTVSQVTALCGVEGGPSYEVALRGEASRISYLLDTTEIDCGLQVFNKVTEAAVTLQNSGKLGFAFAVLSPGTGTAASPLPGVPLVVPSRGYVEPGKQQVLKVYYLPGVPGVFCRAFQIQLGHLEPEKISLKGEGTFPRIHLDLPRNIKGNAKYEKILLKAKEKLDKGSQREEAIALGEAVAAEPRVDDSGTVWDAQLQMQMEEMLIEEHALEQQKALASRPPEDTAFHQRVHRRLLKLVGTPVACLQGPRG
ncbi:hydrocephalus-inducing protein-like [Lathamus discolor]|uniref:hydrocephalus-inducing protein-like n=1 Tax=Lathamus discolor TaxID=678569 RepID=UPI0032B76268